MLYDNYVKKGAESTVRKNRGKIYLLSNAIEMRYSNEGNH